jgi:hypothetical protein
VLADRMHVVRQASVAAPVPGEFVEVEIALAQDTERQQSQRNAVAGSEEAEVEDVDQHQCREQVHDHTSGTGLRGRHGRDDGAALSRSVSRHMLFDTALASRH